LGKKIINFKSLDNGSFEGTWVNQIYLFGIK